MELYRGAEIKTVYIGGGTPSILTPRQYEAVVKKLYELFDISRTAEFTLEANPESMDREKIRVWKSSGVNRISLGVQSFDDSVLEFWGRKTRRSDTIRAVAALSEEDIRNFNIDLILGIQVHRDRTASNGLFKRDLMEAVALDPSHLSVYILSLHSGRMSDLVNTAGVRLLDDKTCEKLYYFTVGYLSAHGYGQYEVSNFAKSGFASIHNLNYWKGGDYIGLGLGAVTTENGIRRKNTECFEKYIETSEKGFQPVEETEILGERELFYERIMLSLRMLHGIELSELKSGPHKKDRVELDNFIDELLNLGYAEKKSGRLALTPSGLFRSTYIISKLLTFFD